MNARAFWLSALIAGALMGLLANLPVLNLINCILCIWIWLGGALAVYLYRRYHPANIPPTVGQGALLGVVAGLIAAVVGLVVFMLTGALSMPLFNTLARAFSGLTHYGYYPCGPRREGGKARLGGYRA